jgi:hypothetical protein
MSEMDKPRDTMVNGHRPPPIDDEIGPHLRKKDQHQQVPASASQKSLLTVVSDPLTAARRASEYLIEVPVENLRRIAQTKGINSLDRETQHFTS